MIFGFIVIVIGFIFTYVYVHASKPESSSKKTFIIATFMVLATLALSIGAGILQNTIPLFSHKSDPIVSDMTQKDRTEQNLGEPDNQKEELAQQENELNTTVNISDNSNQQNSLIDNSSEEISSSKNEQENKTEAVSLHEIKTYLQDGSITYEEMTSERRGNTYSNAYVFWAEYTTLNTGGGHYDKPYLEKYLGGMYNDFSVKIMPYKDFDKYNKNVEAAINIYADEKLIYTSNNITRKTDCEEINISVKAVNYLRIELTAKTDLTNYYNQYSVIICDAKLTKK